MQFAVNSLTTFVWFICFALSVCLSLFMSVFVLAFAFVHVFVFCVCIFVFFLSARLPYLTVVVILLES